MNHSMPFITDLETALTCHGRFSLNYRDPHAHGKPITLNGYRAAGATEKSPVVIVQHGVLRNGDEYRDFWVNAAELHGLLVVAPTFAEADWPDVHAYNNGNLQCEEHPQGVTDPEASSYACVQRLVRQLAASRAVDADQIYFFGHSAGSQFVHRYLALCGPSGFAGVVAANAGWYTLPDLSLPFPQGWAKTRLSLSDLARMFDYPLHIFAGCNDNDPQAPHLPNEPAARLQGPTRFDRAHYFHEYARRQAESLGVPYRWTLHTIPEVAHDGRLMSHVAAGYWFGAGIPQASELRRLAQGSASFTA